MKKAPSPICLNACCVSTPKIRTGCKLAKWQTLIQSHKKPKFTESQIIKAIKEAENGRPAAEVSRDYNRKKKLAGMHGEQLRRLNDLKEVCKLFFYCT
jgi:hypothetical protein